MVLFLNMKINCHVSTVLDMKLLGLTIGFDERFAIRALMRAGIGGGDRVLVFVAEPMEERAERCLKLFREFVSKYVEDVNLKIVEVKVGDFSSAVLRMKRALEDFVKGADEVVLNLSGGMRALILEALSAAVLLELDLTVEVELENLRGLIAFPLRLLGAESLSREEIRILSVLVEAGGELDLSEVSEMSSMPRSSVHKRLRRLVERGLVEAKRVGRRMLYSVRREAIVYL
jgi:CRISPR-associated protein Csa3